jgi:hypothetical protein
MLRHRLLIQVIQTLFDQRVLGGQIPMPMPRQILPDPGFPAGRKLVRRDQPVNDRTKC